MAVEIVRTKKGGYHAKSSGKGLHGDRRLKRLGNRGAAKRKAIREYR